ncbi:hypothetical protein SSS_01685 [Sarcoptes scabiei]|nr:hypothetical protein SSS_01685 [Sarcoptes scabiei]
MSIIYRNLVRRIDPLVPAKFRPLWEHEAGPKTVFFWAPAVKWGLVIASLSDLTRPIDQIVIGCYRFDMVPLLAGYNSKELVIILGEFFCRNHQCHSNVSNL